MMCNKRNKMTTAKGPKTHSLRLKHAGFTLAVLTFECATNAAAQGDDPKTDTEWRAVAPAARTAGLAAPVGEEIDTSKPHRRRRHGVGCRDGGRGRVLGARSRVCRKRSSIR